MENRLGVLRTWEPAEELHQVDVERAVARLRPQMRNDRLEQLEIVGLVVEARDDLRQVQDFPIGPGVFPGLDLQTPAFQSPTKGRRIGTASSNTDPAARWWPTSRNPSRSRITAIAACRPARS